MNYLLDTDTCIYWIKGRQSVRERLLAVGWGQASICVITAAELYCIARSLSDVHEEILKVMAI